MSENRQTGNELAKSRHRSRELALSTMYACEIGTNEHWEIMLERIADEEQLSPEVKRYARDLVRATFDHSEAIDAALAEKAANWELRRMAAVDRNVLRMATAELLYFSDRVPFKVVIDEAVEIAKTFGTEDSGKFVNGILDSIHKKLSNKANSK
ncbi:MAG: transcription antitermination factor NusB [Chitinispirillaceae bacterium]